MPLETFYDFERISKVINGPFGLFISIISYFLLLLIIELGYYSLHNSHSKFCQTKDIENRVCLTLSLVLSHFYKHSICTHWTDPVHLQGLINGLLISSSPKHTLQDNPAIMSQDGLGWLDWFFFSSYSGRTELILRSWVKLVWLSFCTMMSLTLNRTLPNLIKSLIWIKWYLFSFSTIHN